MNRCLARYRQSLRGDGPGSDTQHNVPSHRSRSNSILGGLSRDESEPELMASQDMR